MQQGSMCVRRRAGAAGEQQQVGVVGHVMGPASLLTMSRLTMQCSAGGGQSRGGSAGKGEGEQSRGSMAVALIVAASCCTSSFND